MSNIISATFSCGSTTSSAGGLWQYDYGQRLVFAGLDLPPVYEVHFANEGETETVTVLGDETGVDIPDQFLLSGNAVRAWVFLHTGTEDGETMYAVRMPVNKRPEPSDIEPTPVQQDIITQAIAALDAAVEQTGQDVETTAGYMDRAEQAAEQAEQAAQGVEEYAERAETAAEDAEASATSAGQSEQTATQAASAAVTAADQAGTSAGQAQQAASDAGQAATQAVSAAGQAVASATTAEAKAAEAVASASAAAESAESAAGSETVASQAAQTATTKAEEASASATAASQSATAAAGSASDASDDADRAETAAGSVSAAAEQIVTNTADIADLKDDLSNLGSEVGSPEYVIGSPLTLITTNGAWRINGYFANNSYLTTKIPVTPGESYAVSTAVQSSVNFGTAIFLNSSDDVVGIYQQSTAQGIVIVADEIVTIPDGVAYMCITTLKASMNPMVVKTANLVPVYDMAKENKANYEDLFDHKNLINPDEINLEIRYSSAANKLVSDISNYAGTGMIPVEEGEMYTFSGTAMSMLGAYFDEDAKMVVGQSAIGSITFFNPVTGDGKVFTVPEGEDIRYVSLVLKKANGAVNGTYQLEKGEMATEIVPYSDITIKKSLLPAASVQPAADLDSLPVPQYDLNLIKPMQKFRDHWAKKDKDLVVVGTGTSLTARGAEHCTSRGDAASRPPLMDSNNFASAMWDLMRWEGQEYRRYDYTGFFTETGTFLTSKNLSDWDDANYHDAWTRYSSGNCSVSYIIPSDAWQANFIYRTDSQGSQVVSVTVAEGNGEMLVWDESESDWVEANGYTFSMLETPVILPEVSVPNPRGNEDNSNFTLYNYQVSGNTTYQKRLKMKAVSRETTKTITVSSTSGRFMYWGVEWSVREFMITYVNSARGSHNMTVDSENALQKYQDNEIWSFKPDLIFTENPIHNSGGSGSANGFSSYFSSYWRNVTYDFFFNTETNPVSLLSRAIAYGMNPANIEWCIFNTSISVNFGGIDDDGLLKIQPDRNGRMITALDAQMMSQDYITETGKAVSINACKYWVDAALKMFGNLKAATEGSGKDGATFTNEGSHWNDTGCAVMARCVGGVFDFYN